MKSNSLKKNFPVLLGIFLIFAIATTIFLIQQGVLTITRAKPTSIPQKIQVTNVSDSSFTIIFTTELSVPGAIKIPEGGVGNSVILDDRDKSSGAQNSYYSHHITVPNLKPSQTYSFIIISDGKEYASPAQYLVTTGAQITSPPPAQNPLYGTVILPDGGVGVDTIVTARAENSQIISSVTNKTGNYIIPTNSLKTDKLTGYANLSENSQIFLNFFRQNFTAKITTDYKLGQNLPAITLNQTYSFFPQEEISTQTPEQGFESIAEAPISSSEPLVISPRENQSFIDQTPTFSGTGGVNRKVTITIPSASIEQQVDISPQGRWTFQPKENLAQGEYTVDFSIQNEAGVSSVISRSFSIFPSGSQIAQSATPSATPTFTPSPTPTEPAGSLTPTLTATPIPSVTVSITPAVSPTPTLTPTPQISAEPTTSISPTEIPTSTPLPPIDKPGDASSTTILTVFSIILIVAGAAIFFAL